MTNDEDRDKSTDPYVVRDISGQVPYMRIEINQWGHVLWRQTTENFEHVAMPVHRLLAISEFGTEAVKDMHVHHKNGTPWDNRPENLELLTPEEHARHHRRIPDEELLEDLRVGAEVLGVAPTREDIRQYGEYDPQTYSKRFGSFVSALRAAGIEPRKTQMDGEGSSK